MCNEEERPRGRDCDGVTGEVFKVRLTSEHDDILRGVHGLPGRRRRRMRPARPGSGCTGR